MRGVDCGPPVDSRSTRIEVVENIGRWVMGPSGRQVAEDEVETQASPLPVPAALLPPPLVPSSEHYSHDTPNGSVQDEVVIA